MTEQVLLNILDKLGEEEFQRFKWCLEKEDPKDSSNIPKSKLENAKRWVTVDLMIQTYAPPGAVEVTKKILKTINRNDLVQKLTPTSPTTEGPRNESPQRNVPAGVAVPAGDTDQAGDAAPAEEKLFSVRKEFVKRVSQAVLNQLLDRLLEQHVVNDVEVESVRIGGRVDQARDVIDMVRRKGTYASSVLIAALREVDPVLSEVLKLS